ncbi:MAG: hypothetical protein JXO72_03090 [Vicinamibacteria bacterium]|nr:hypothetical protein [Vicinamibacteria bacterium]
MDAKRVIITAMCWFAPHFVWAQSLQNVVLRNSFNPIGAGARGAGMGGAFIAVVDDGTAASFNPAGLAQLRRSEIALVSFATWSAAKLARPDAPVTEVEKARENVPEFIGLALPLEAGARRLTLQLSYQRSVDLFGRGDATVVLPNDSWEASGPESRLIPVSPLVRVDSNQSGAFHTFSLAAGLELTDAVSVGGSINSWIGEWQASGMQVLSLRSLDASASGDVYNARAFFDQDQSLRGMNANLGILLRYPAVSIGGVMRLPFAGSYKLEETIVEWSSARMESTDNRDVWMNSRLRWPRSGGVGIAIRPFRGLTVAADYSYAEWARAVIEDVPGDAFLPMSLGFTGGDSEARPYINRNFFDLSPASETLTKNAGQFRFGAEFLLSFPRFVVPLRCGAFQERSPVPDLGTMTPDPETAKGRKIRGLTFGTGVNFDRIVVDLAYEIRHSEGAVGFRLDEVGDAAEQPSYPREKVKQSRIVASIILRLGSAADDPIKRWLRSIFVGSKG